MTELKTISSMPIYRQFFNNQMTNFRNYLSARLALELDDGISENNDLLIPTLETLANIDNQNMILPKFTDRRLRELRKEMANDYLETAWHKNDLMECDAKHQALISDIFDYSGLAKKMIEEGNKGYKFGIVELSSRLMPCLNPEGSSAFYEVGIVPYGKHAREVLGENHEGHKLVSIEAAEESTRCLISNFNATYALAESSSAPRPDVPKSGRYPEVHICAVNNGQLKNTVSYEIPVDFRPQFNSIVRELMFEELKKLYEY